MKLAQLILPKVDNQGASLVAAHEALKSILLARWGGYTAVDGRGAWSGLPTSVKSEPVVIYSVAMERADVVAFRSLATEVAKHARQEAVMIVTPNGDVEFVHPEKSDA